MNNRPRLHAVVVITVLLALAFTLAACEKDRPVQTQESGTAQPLGGQASPLTPGPAETRGPASIETTTGSQSTPSSPAPSSSATTKPVSSGTAVKAATQAPSQSTVYTVQLGDTLGSIAEEFGVSADAIVRANSLTNPDVLMVGQELKIPAQQAASAGGGANQATEGVYVVSQGDTLGSIAKRLGVSVADLQDLNDIADPDQIFVGQELRLPAPASASGGAATPTPGENKTYVVQQGETLFKIALRFGITLEALEAANNITDPNKVYPGQVLKIP